MAERVWNVACSMFFIIAGVSFLRRRDIPMGVEGQSPSFHLRGRAAVWMSLAMMLLGAALTIYFVVK